MEPCGTIPPGATREQPRHATGSLPDQPAERIMAQDHARRSGQQVQPVIAMAARQRRGRSHCVHTVAPLRRPRDRSACDEKGRPARRLSRSVP
jgi:hypothetical protein